MGGNTIGPTVREASTFAGQTMEEALADFSAQAQEPDADPAAMAILAYELKMRYGNAQAILNAVKDASDAVRQAVERAI